ncbi:MAG: DUF2207 domain-containing protein [Oscillospiraceae bacterium]
MKKLFILAAMAAMMLFAAPCANAAELDTGYNILDYNIDAVYHENNTVTQTEVLTVRFNEARHGIYRAFPSTVKVEKATPDGVRTVPYKIKIRDISVPGFEHETEYNNGLILLKIGDKDETLFGEVTYSISFTMDMGDDRIEDYDEVFYTLLGVDFTAPVEHCTFSLSFDKPLPSGTVPTVYSGVYGNKSGDNSKLSFTASENAIFGESVSPLALGEGISVYTKLPEGYFTNEREYSKALPWIAIIATGILALAAIAYCVTVHTQKPVQTVEFYPPNGVTPAEVGFIIDGSASDKDLLSLIIYFADKGYCTLSGEENFMSVTRVKPLPENSPHYMQTFFDALFEKGETCALKDPGVAFYNALQGAKSMLGSEFQGQRKLDSPSASALALSVPFIFGGLFVLITLASTQGISTAAVILSVFSALAIGFAGVACYMAKRSWNFASMGTRAAYLVGIGVLSSVGVGIAVLADYFSTIAYIMPPYTITASYLICLIAALCISRTSKPSAYYTEVAGKLMGLRAFIEKAELARIELLVRDNPEYFYSILPYAYVFGLSDTWTKQFETMAVPPPTWYCGGNLSMFDMYWISRSLNHSYSDMITHVSAANMQSGGNGGTSFGGGGGFSGGGFGGGGGGSW